MRALQNRSRKTEDALLAAAEQVLEREGLEGATVPAIAKLAGVSVGTLYRRFPDKDALVRAVCEAFFLRSALHNSSALEPARWQGVPLAKLACQLVEAMTHGLRQHRGLLRALLLFMQQQKNRKFRRHADELSNEALRQMGDLLLARKKEIRAPNPERAVRLGLLTISFALRGMLLSDESSLHPAVAALVDEEELTAELERSFLAALGVARA